jgi:hypothetical protein
METCNTSVLAILQMLELPKRPIEKPRRRCDDNIKMHIREIRWGSMDWINLKSTVFWDITPCSPLRVNRRFGGTYRLHLQGRKNKFRKKSRESRCTLVSCWTYFFNPEDGGDMFLRNVGWHSTDYTTLSIKSLRFITTAVRTSNPTWINLVQTRGLWRVLLDTVIKLRAL